MRTRTRLKERKSAEARAFASYLRTGRYLVQEAPSERKFNPYHDSRNGQFTFAPGGPKSVSNPIFSDRRGLWKRNADSRERASHSASPEAAQIQPSPLSSDTPAVFTPANLRPNPRARIGGNRGPSLNDPLVLEQVFPTLREAPAGAIIGVADNILDLSGPARAATDAIHQARVRQLISQIRAIDPDYTFEVAAWAETIEGRANEIRALRLDRALAFYRIKGEMRPLQVEVARIMQERADAAYEEAVRLYEAGRLTPRLSRNEAIGNHIDAAVRADLRAVFNVNGVDISRGQPVRVVGREYNTSGTDLTYRIPDARVGNVAFDVTMTRKTLGTAQVRGFFDADFSPATVVIIRPHQLGKGNTYAIKRPD